MRGVAQSRNDIPGIRILRGIAALGVVVHHALEQSAGAVVPISPDWLTTAGASGVDIFFVISGYVMLRASFRTGHAPLRPTQFLLRRIARIYPLYWLSCICILALVELGFLQGHAWRHADILPALLLVPYPERLLNVSWTLFYEMYFYWIFAATLPLASRTATTISCTLCIVSLWLASIAMGEGRLTDFLDTPIPLEFCMGLALAYYGIAFPWIVCLLGLGVLAVAPIFITHRGTMGLDGMSRVLAWGVPATFVVGGLLRFRDTSSPLARFGVLLGDSSYSLYLTHPFVMIVYYWLLKNTALKTVTQIPMVPLTVLVSIIVGVCTYRLVERPLLRVVSTVRTLDIRSFEKLLRARLLKG